MQETPRTQGVRHDTTGHVRGIVAGAAGGDCCGCGVGRARYVLGGMARVGLHRCARTAPCSQPAGPRLSPNNATCWARTAQRMLGHAPMWIVFTVQSLGGARTYVAQFADTRVLS